MRCNGCIYHVQCEDALILYKPLDECVCVFMNRYRDVCIYFYMFNGFIRVHFMAFEFWHAFTNCAMRKKLNVLTNKIVFCFLWRRNYNAPKIGTLFAPWFILPLLLTWFFPTDYKIGFIVFFRLRTNVQFIWCVSIGSHSPFSHSFDLFAFVFLSLILFNIFWLFISGNCTILRI